MGLIFVPVKKEKLSDWKNWTQKLKGEKSSEFRDLNKRYELTRHSVWLTDTKYGPLAVVLHEGPGADSFMPKLSESDNKFDVWFKESVEDIHGMKPDQPPTESVPQEMI
ncbi:MAG: hypothetical protein ACOC1D_00415 [Prolixibacteraceae bacterium]